MKTFKSLELALEDVFDSPFSKLNKVLQKRVNEDFHPWPWEKMDADQRRNRAKAWDFQNDPTNIELRDGIAYLTASDSPGYSLDEVKRLRGDYLDEPLREIAKPAELPPLKWESLPAFEVRKRLPSVADTTPLDPQVKLAQARTPALMGQGGTGTIWTTERKDSARAMMDKLRGQGNKAFAKNTAVAFGVSATRLREVLNDKPKKEPAKKAKGIWDV